MLKKALSVSTFLLFSLSALYADGIFSSSKNGEIAAAGLSISGASKSVLAEGADSVSILSDTGKKIEIKMPGTEFNGLRIFADGKEAVRFNDKMQNKSVPFSSLDIQAKDGIISLKGNGKAEFIRKGSDSNSEYSILIESNGELKASFRKYRTEPFQMASLMNMGFADEKAGDGKGGWTDQGPDRDMRSFKPESFVYNGAVFNFSDPDYNDGKGCLVLGKKRISSLPEESTALQGKGKTASQFYILHSLAWPPRGGDEAGRIKIVYEDDSKSEIIVKSGIDASEWNKASRLSNGAPAWGNKEGAGLYMSVFNLETKPIREISFSNKGENLWMIVACGLAYDILPDPQPLPCVIKESSDWKSFEFKRDIEKNSIMDFSSLLDAPAGKYGRLIVQGENFVFEKNPSVAQRFYGVNMCYWSGKAWSKESSDILADRLAASGFNSIRLHAYDSSFSIKGKPTTELNPDALDKFDYLLHACKERGIYMTIDMFVHRGFEKGEIPELDRRSDDLDDLKTLIPISKAAMQNWKDFTKNLLTHVNPYTGMRWVDDPALISISMVNENTIPFLYSGRISKRPDVKALYETRFNEWLNSKNLSIKESERDAYRFRFMLEIYSAAYKEMAEYVRSLGAKQPFTEQNNGDNAFLAFTRKDYDYADNHFYYDFPQFLKQAWGLPLSIKNISAVTSMNPSQSSSIAPRILGKPYMITEFNWVYPNRCRGEAGAITSAYGALQDWSGIYLYQYSSGEEAQLRNDAASTRWELCNDPVIYMSMRIGALLYLRGDVRTSKVTIPVIVDEKSLRPGNIWRYPGLVDKLGLVAKTGSVVYEDKTFKPVNPGSFAISLHGNSEIKSCKLVDFSVKNSDQERIKEIGKLCGGFDKGALDPARRYARSSTGEIELDGEKETFSVISSKTEVLVIPSAGKFDAKILSVDNKTAFATIMASAMDGKSLEESKRILVFHVTDVMNSNVRFSDSTMKVLEDYGKLPHLARKGEAVISLKIKVSDKVKIRAVDFCGKTLGEIPAVKTDSGFEFKADSLAFNVPCMAYEVDLR